MKQEQGGQGVIQSISPAADQKGQIKIKRADPKGAVAGPHCMFENS